jgi:hypothetical protein
VTTGVGGSGATNGNGGTSGGTRGGGGSGDGITTAEAGGGSGPCADDGWLCKIDACDGKPKTSVRAKVYDPAAKVPLYNVAVYVPNEGLSDIATGPVCDTCATPVSGKPVASALTDAHGEFVMQDVPVGTNVPLVIQIGKWRRQVQMPEVKACQENVIDDPQLMRLPKNQSEGHLPRFALTTGEADSLECLLRRIGISDSEFTNPDGPGRINLYGDDLVGEASVDQATSSYASGASFPLASQLFSSDASLGAYDIVLLSCQGSEAAGRGKTTAQKQVLKNFLDTGGRAFLEHYHYSWLRGGVIVGNMVPMPSAEGAGIDYARKYTQTPFPPIAVWEGPGDGFPYAPGGPGTYTIDTGFPKGSDMADWLVNVGASTTRGSIALIDVKNPATSVLPDVAQRWIYDNTLGLPYLSANTPLEKAATPDQQCGRLVHTGIHVAIVANDRVAPFPGGCRAGDLSPQEKAMEFLLFDLSSCVMNDKTKSKPPDVTVR